MGDMAALGSFQTTLFAQGELAKVDKINLKRARIDLYLSLGEPVLASHMDGPFELYDEKVKSNVADIKNVGEGRWGGAITAAKFLENFVGDVPWVHLDIAGPAFAESPKAHRDAGATGCMVRTLVQWLETVG